MTLRIALFRMSALGDCVLLLPSIRALQAAMPEAKITWIIEANLLPLFESIQGIEFIAIKKPRSINDYLALRKQLMPYEFDILLAMQASLRANLIYPLIKAKRKIGFDKVRGRELHGLFINERIPFAKEHLLEGFMAFAKQVCPEISHEIDKNNLKWNLTVDEGDSLWLDQQLEKFPHAKSKSVHSKPKMLVINPAASKLERCCSSTFYADVLVKASKQFDCYIVMTGGSAQWEKNLAQEIADRYRVSSGERILNLVGKTTLKQLLTVLSQADVLLAPDTGPIHIADALGVPVVGFYAVAPPELTGPYQNLNTVVNKYPLALKRLLKKDSKTVKWGTRVHHPKAMSFFEVDEVIEKLGICFNKKN